MLIKRPNSGYSRMLPLGNLNLTLWFTMYPCPGRGDLSELLQCAKTVMLTAVRKSGRLFCINWKYKLPKAHYRYYIIFYILNSEPVVAAEVGIGRYVSLTSFLSRRLWAVCGLWRLCLSVE